MNTSALINQSQELQKEKYHTQIKLTLTKEEYHKLMHLLEKLDNLAEVLHRP